MDHLLAQVNHAIDIFNGLTNGGHDAQALFIFDNAPSHQKRANDAISAQRMVKGALFSPSLNLSSFSHSHDLIPGDQNQRRDGSINLVDHACVAVDYLPVNPSHFTFPMITPGCQAGSRACGSYSSNVGCGQKRGYLLSAKISSAPLVARTAAAGASSFFNLTSQSNVHSSRSSLRGVATCAISIPSTIANSISLSSIGEQRRPNTVCFPE